MLDEYDVTQPDDEDGSPPRDFESELDAMEQTEQPAAKPELTKQPLFQTLFMQSIPAEDAVLQDFGKHVVGPLSDYFALKSAKGGAFFRKKAAEGAPNTERYARDQTLRAHLINGMLPALRVARLLKQWRAPKLERDWDERTERLFIAGYMLHDYIKIDAAQVMLRQAGFTSYGEMSTPSSEQVVVLEGVFRHWCENLGLQAFLDPVGGLEYLLHDLIYVASNTQQLSGTANNPGLLPRISTDVDVYQLAASFSHLADLMAYVAPTPRQMVTQETVHKLIRLNGDGVARLTYHHVAENRGLLLNFIHNGALEALEIPDVRVPLLYAPSGVVYLEHRDAPPMSTVAELVPRIVANVRQQAGQRLIETGKGARRGNNSLQIDSSYDDFFSLPEMIRGSTGLIARYIRGKTANKTGNRLASLRAKGGMDIPDAPTDPADARCDQIAEWATFMEKQFRDRLGDDGINARILTLLGIEDLADGFAAAKAAGESGAGGSGGFFLWWFWAAAHALNRRPGLNDTETLRWLAEMSESLAVSLPETLPPAAQVNEVTWDDLADYVGRVLTLGGQRHASIMSGGELNRYTRAKGRNGTVCAICSSDYTTRKPKESAVAFQPGVYTARLTIAKPDNARPLCTLCATEQLLRQLFFENTNFGRDAEAERSRYLSFYPSYFFTPETLRFVRIAYNRLKDVRVGELKSVLNDADLTDATIWQRLEQFLLRPRGDNTPARRVQRFSEQGQATFLMVGLKNWDATETESWILPALLSLVFAVLLDIKVITSDSGVPLMTEAAELNETVWFDGAHPAVLDLLGQSRLNIDEIADALARLAAAYIIHLDTERGKRGEENFHRFGPIAHSLMESPLYVFHYLKKQERDNPDRPANSTQINRYVRFAETLFNQQGDPLMTHASELVDLYRQFYRAKTIKNANSVLRPLSVVADALLTADLNLFPDDESLVEVAYGELYRFMDRVGKGLADGRFPTGISPADRDAAMQVFCRKFVNDIFSKAFNRDVAALRGKQLNLLRSACEVLYRKAQIAEWEARGRDVDIDEDDDSESEPANTQLL